MLTAAEWTRWVEQWERSGLDTVEFAQREGLVLEEFDAWCRKQGACSPPPADPRLQLIHAVKPSPSRTTARAPAWIKIPLPNDGLLCVLPPIDAGTVACMLAVATELSAKDIGTVRSAPCGAGCTATPREDVMGTQPDWMDRDNDAAEPIVTARPLIAAHHPSSKAQRRH